MYNCTLSFGLMHVFSTNFTSMAAEKKGVGQLSFDTYKSLVTPGFYGAKKQQESPNTGAR